MSRWPVTSQSSCFRIFFASFFCFLALRSCFFSFFCSLPVFDCHLSLAIRAQPPELSTLTYIRQGLSQACCHGVSQRHAILCLIARVSEHDPLVTGTNIKIILADMDAASDIRTLFVDANQHLACLV